MFANQYLAYEALSPGMQEMLSGLNAVHSDASLQKRNAGQALCVKAGAEDRGVFEATHPVVRTHPETGRKSLFVHRPYTIRFENILVEESAPLLSFLYAHSARPEFTCRFRWQEGSLSFWDNRCLQHFALNDYSLRSPGDGRRRCAALVDDFPLHQCVGRVGVVVRLEDCFHL